MAKKYEPTKLEKQFAIKSSKPYVNKKFGLLKTKTHDYTQPAFKDGTKGVFTKAVVGSPGKEFCEKAWDKTIKQYISWSKKQ